MFRRLSLVLCAVFLAVGASFPALLHARTGHALGAACWYTDNPGVAYKDWYNVKQFSVHDSYDNKDKLVYTDIRAWRLSGGLGTGLDGHCYRAYYASVWTSDGSGAYIQVYLRQWVCGIHVGDLSYPSTWGSRGEVYTNNYGTTLTQAVTLDSNETVLLDFWDYGTDANSCLPQADNLTTAACSYTWDSCPKADSTTAMFYNYSHPPPN